MTCIGGTAIPARWQPSRNVCRSSAIWRARSNSDATTNPASRGGGPLTAPIAAVAWDHGNESGIHPSSSAADAANCLPSPVVGAAVSSPSHACLLRSLCMSELLNQVLHHPARRLVRNYYSSTPSIARGVEWPRGIRVQTLHAHTKDTLKSQDEFKFTHTCKCTCNCSNLRFAGKVDKNAEKLRNSKFLC